MSNKAKHVLVENELNELFEKVKAISTKGLRFDKLSFLVEQNVFLQEYFKII